MPTLEQVIADKENFDAPITKYRTNPNQAVTTDILDCDGCKRIATIANSDTKMRTKLSLSKLFSPIVTRPNCDYQEITKNNSEASSKEDEEASSSSSNKKRPRDIIIPALQKGVSLALSEKRRKRGAKLVLEDLLIKAMGIVAVDSKCKVYDSCPEVVDKIHKFLQRDGADRAMLVRCLDVHGNSLRAFLLGKDQEQCENITYKRAYIFFEKLRIALGEKKTFRRLQNEENFPDGFSLVKKYQTEKQQTVVGLSESEFC